MGGGCRGRVRRTRCGLVVLRLRAGTGAYRSSPCASLLCDLRDTVVPSGLLSYESHSLARERRCVVPISLRAAALRTALERVLDEPVHALKTDDGTRIHAPAPVPEDEGWADVYATLRAGDVW